MRGASTLTLQADRFGVGAQVEPESSAAAGDAGARAFATMRRVIVVITGSEDFGVRTFLLTQFRHADQGGMRFDYVALQDGECAKTLRAAGASVHVIGGDIAPGHPGHPLLLLPYWLLRLPTLYQAYASIRRYLEGTVCDIVYAHDYYVLALCGLAARGMGCRVVGHLHGSLNENRLAGLQRILVSLVLAASADRLVAISDFVAASLWGPARRKARRIYNGIDIDTIATAVQGVAKNPRRIVVVSRLIAWKKQQVAIRAIGLLRGRGIDCELEIIGGRGAASDRHHRTLQNLVRTLGLAERVRFAGVVSPPYRRIATAAVCVSCATREPFGLVVVEAAACGTPVVAADAGGTAELIEDGRSGVLVRPDHPGALADALERLLRDAPLRLSLAEAARRRALERYDIGGHLRALRSCFDDVVARP